MVLINKGKDSTTKKGANDKGLFFYYLLLKIFQNTDFYKYNKLALDIYGNNTTLTTDSIVQNIKSSIYNVPIKSYIGNRKISSELIYYYNIAIHATTKESPFFVIILEKETLLQI